MDGLQGGAGYADYAELYAVTYKFEPNFFRPTDGFLTVDTPSKAVEPLAVDDQTCCCYTLEVYRAECRQNKSHQTAEIEGKGNAA